MPQDDTKDTETQDEELMTTGEVGEELPELDAVDMEEDAEDDLSEDELEEDEDDDTEDDDLFADDEEDEDVEAELEGDEPLTQKEEIEGDDLDDMNGMTEVDPEATV